MDGPKQVQTGVNERVSLTLTPAFNPTALRISTKRQIRDKRQIHLDRQFLLLLTCIGVCVGM